MQKGVALILVLWTLVLLTVIAGSLVTATRSELSMTRNLLDEVQGRGVIEAGFTYVLASYLWGNRVEVEEVLPADGQLRDWSFAGHPVRVGLIGEEVKIDLNLADEELIKGALLAVGLEDDEAEQLRDAIADWRDVDDLHRLVGAEDPEYESAGYSYGAKDGKFDTVAELGLVYGMTKVIYDRIAPLFTVYSGTKTINPMHAGREVLMAIPGVSEDQVNDFLESRDTENPLDSPAIFPAADKRYISTGESGIYRIISEVESPSGHQLRGEMMVDLRPRGRNRYRILHVSYNAGTSKGVPTADIDE
jgi:general secretion pathway protein K